MTLPILGDEPPRTPASMLGWGSTACPAYSTLHSFRPLSCLLGSFTSFRVAACSHMAATSTLSSAWSANLRVLHDNWVGPLTALTYPITLLSASISPVSTKLSLPAPTMSIRACSPALISASSL